MSRVKQRAQVTLNWLRWLCFANNKHVTDKITKEKMTL